MNLIETPFMMELVVKCLPEIYKIYYSLPKIN